MTKEDEFDKWYEEYFCNQQGEDSPYSYNDVKIAFLKAWKLSRAEALADEIEWLEETFKQLRNLRHENAGLSCFQWRINDRIAKLKELKAK